MDDLISRQAAIDAMEQAKEQYFDRKIIIGKMRDIVNNLPPAQPETHDKRTETHACDLIDRQAAIDEIGEWIKAFLENGHKESAADARLIQDGIIQLPSAQPVDKDINVPTNDYISRQAAIDSICRTVCDNPEICESPCDEIKVLETMPSAQPDLSGYSDRLWKAAYERGKVEAQRKKGKWIEYDNSHCECPFCHEEWSYFDNEVECFNYCPNCGAEMGDEYN